MSTVVHFEIPVDDQQRAQQFYETLFGWKMEKAPLPIDYWLWDTEDASGQAGAGGGMSFRKHLGQPILIYFGVPSIDDYLEKVEKLGGQVYMPKTSFPGYGHVAVCFDTEGNSFAIWEQDRAK